MSASGSPQETRFYKIRNRFTGQFKTKGIGGWAKKGRPGHIWSKSALKGHLSLFKDAGLSATSKVYNIPEEYEILEYIAKPSAVTPESCLPAGAVVTFCGAPSF